MATHLLCLLPGSFFCCVSLTTLLFLDPQRGKRGYLSQRAGAPHAGPGVCRGRQLLGAADGAAGGHPGCSAAGAPAQRERLSWTQLQQGTVKKKKSSAVLVLPGGPIQRGPFSAA